MTDILSPEAPAPKGSGRPVGRRTTPFQRQPAVAGSADEPPAGSPLNADEQELLANVDESLASGVEVMRWFERAEATGQITDRFELTRVYNRPDNGYSFFATADLSGGPMPVMGDVPDVFYDQPKGHERLKWRAEVEEFALRYFMRVSDFRTPEVVAQDDRGGPRVRLPGPSLCLRPLFGRKGFGFQQLYYKRTGTGEIGRFPEEERYAIVDQRELGRRFDWIVASVRIFDFDLTFPVDPQLPRVSIPLREIAYIIFSADYVLAHDQPPPGTGGRYTFGYSMLRTDQERSILAYGPGHFAAGFQLFDFRVLDDGTIRVRMPFVVNRPRRILNLSLDPLQWAITGTEIATLGLAKPFLAPFQTVVDRLPLNQLGFDPIFGSIALLNLFTFGQAAQQYCISRQQLEKIMLIYHFNQYYTMITGSLLTWRQIENWLDTANLPRWVIDGRSS